MVATAIGIIVSSLLTDIINLPELINAIFWFLICFTTYYFARRMDYGWFKMISLDFFLTWAFVCIGVILGLIILQLINTGSVTANLEQLTSFFYSSLPLALGPTATTSMGLRD